MQSEKLLEREMHGKSILSTYIFLSSYSNSGFVAFMVYIMRTAGGKISIATLYSYRTALIAQCLALTPFVDSYSTTYIVN